MTKRKPKDQHKPTGRRPWRFFTKEEEATMIRLWSEGRSQTFIAKEFSTHQVVVSRVLRAQGIHPTRRTGNRRGAESHGWKGGRFVADGGYIWKWVAIDHPFASMRNRMGYVPEHRLVMAEKLGRPLTRGETVHHINSVRDDNRFENLELWAGRHPRGEKITGIHCPTCACPAHED